MAERSSAFPAAMKSLRIVAFAAICATRRQDAKSLGVADALALKATRGSGRCRTGDCGGCRSSDTELRVSATPLDVYPSAAAAPNAPPMEDADMERELGRHLTEMSERTRRRRKGASASAAKRKKPILVRSHGSSGGGGGGGSGRMEAYPMLARPALTTGGDGGGRNRRATTAAASATTPSSSSARLTREEEVEISDTVRSLRSAIRVRDELAVANGAEPTEREWADACGATVMELRRILHDGQEARTRLVAANAGLVMSMARKYHSALRSSSEGSGAVGTILTLQDMVQEGNLGLMEAAERFEPERGFRFSTYASHWVRQRILRSIADYSRVIRLPAHVHSKLNTIRKAQKDMEKDIGRPPSLPELANRLDLPLDKLRLYTDSSRNVLSLEVPVNGNANADDRRMLLGDVIASRSPTPEEDAMSESLRRDVRAVVDGCLADRERDVLVARYGLEDGSPRTVGETARELGISRDRVRTVEARALNKLRHPERNYRLKEYVGRDGDDDDEDEEEMVMDDLDRVVGSSPESLWSF